ncbi:hypothetical protein K469DRAFT_356417 [Zopfia rhizophila CBS 207.26]|uniref:Uncharacterized protein n=1 Tax=Zopfia rhizophila CBS 207.26 TaxID=1314779 RepID=A0A6A6DGV8_9PEZI|nr:hypothetical protein K469DRAFT_356417 [Zopfia rhizophila CBS 207.26]
MANSGLQPNALGLVVAPAVISNLIILVRLWRGTIGRKFAIGSYSWRSNESRNYTINDIWKQKMCFSLLPRFLSLSLHLPLGFLTRKLITGTTNGTALPTQLSTTRFSVSSKPPLSSR